MYKFMCRKGDGGLIVSLLITGCPAVFTSAQGSSQNGPDMFSDVGG